MFVQSELPLVGNVAPDFEAEAVFDQEFINVCSSAIQFYLKCLACYIWIQYYLFVQSKCSFGFGKL